MTAKNRLTVENRFHRIRYNKKQENTIWCHIGHLMYKNSLKNTTNIDFREVKIDGQPYKESPLLARKHAILSAPWKDKSSQQVQQKWSKSMADRLKRNHLSLQDNTCNSVHRERIKVRGSEFLLLQRRNTNLTRIDICLKTFGADGFRCLLIRKV